MKEARYFYVPDAANNTELPEEESLHAIRVLRLQAGDEIFLMDGKGVFFRAEVSLTSSKRCMYAIREVLPQQRAWNGRIFIGMAPTKMMERTEWFVEKATEIGFDSLAFLNCKFSERKTIRTDRVEKIVVSAMKQSRKPWKPAVCGLISFADFVAEPRNGYKFIAHCYNEIERTDLMTELAKNSSGEDVTLLVGPEGDFSVDEVKLAMHHGYVPVSLGSSRLRTETAALMAVTMAHLSLRK